MKTHEVGFHTCVSSHISTLKQSHTHTHSPDTQATAVLVAFHPGFDKGVTFLNLLLVIFFTVQLLTGRVSLGTEGSGGVTEAQSTPLFSPLAWQS